jgi:proline iminopeptidase
LEPTREGYLETRDGRVYYKVMGDGPLTPLVLLHGGPGYPSDYLTGFEVLAKNRSVVLYDQLGCGRSDRRQDRPDLWTLERYVGELEELRKHLSFERMSLYGNSWGAMLATDYILTHPARVSSLIYASPCLSTQLWLQDAALCKEEMGPEWNAAVARLEAQGKTGSAEYAKLKNEFNRRFVCRITPWPPECLKALQGFGAHVYETMWGPAEFTCSGNLRSYDRVPDLHKIRVPVLFTCGKFDEARPETCRFFASKIPGAEVRVFHHSSHLAHVEEPAEYFAAIGGFLNAQNSQ